MGTPARAIVYARISDARNGDAKGVADQEADARALADRIGWTVGRVIIENDVSAFKRRKVTLPDGKKALRVVRPGWREMLDDLAHGHADGVLAYDLDRACRDPRDLEDLVDVVESTVPRVPVESVTGSLSLANDADVTMARVMVAVGNKSSRDTGRRVARARLRQATAGQYGGGRRAYGFESDGVTIRPAEAAEIIRWADAINSGVSLRQVVADLRLRQVPTAATAAAWSPRTVRGILLRPRNAGIAVHQGEEVGKGNWPAILDEPVFRAVVSRLTDPARRSTPGNTPRWLGSLIYRCGVDGCDGLMCVSTSGGHRNPAYRCREKAHLSRAATPVDEWVEMHLVARLRRPDAVDLIARHPEVDTGALHAEGVALRQRRDDLAVDYADGLIGRNAMRAGTERLDQRLDQIDRQLATAAGSDPFVGIAGRPDAARVWAGLDLGRKRAILGKLAIVTILPTKTSRQPDGSYFNPASVRVEPRHP